MTKSSPLIWHYVVSVKLTVKILSIFVAFLENTNFNQNGPQSHFGPWHFWSQRNLDPKKFGPKKNWALHEYHHTAFFSQNQTSWGPNFSGPKWGRGHLSYSLQFPWIHNSNICVPKYQGLFEGRHPMSIDKHSFSLVH